MEREEQIEVLIQAGDLHGAATAVVHAYGREVLGFLMVLLRDEEDASEAYAQACEDLWKGLTRFEGRSSLRTWFYVLARHAAARLRRAPHRRRLRRLPLSELSEVVESVRLQTLSFLRSEAKHRLAALRNSLDEDDRALLVLRVDRDMSWNEIVRVLAPDASTDPEITRASARLRKRFQHVKDDIRRRAHEYGLVPKEGP